MILSNLEVVDSCKLTYITNSVLTTDNVGNILGSSSFSQGSYAPTFTNQSGISTLTTDSGQYIKNGNVVNFSLSLSVTTIGLNPLFDMSLPIVNSGNFTGSNQVCIIGNTFNSGLTTVGPVPISKSNIGALTCRVTLSGLAIGSAIIRLTGQYTLF